MKAVRCWETQGGFCVNPGFYLFVMSENNSAKLYLVLYPPIYQHFVDKSERYAIWKKFNSENGGGTDCPGAAYSESRGRK